MVPCSGLVLLEYFSQFSYTDVDSTPGASTCRRGLCSGDPFPSGACDGSARGLELTCLAAWKMTFCTDGIPEALRVALAAEETSLLRFRLQKDSGKH